MDLDGFTGARCVSRLDHSTVHPDMAFLDEALDGPAGYRGELATQPGVQPRCGQRLVDDDNFSSRQNKIAKQGRSFRRRRFGPFGLTLIFERDEEHETDAGADGGIGDVESRKTDLDSAALLHVKI